METKAKIFIAVLSVIVSLYIIFINRECLTSVYIDPNCLDITKADLINQFDNEEFLREAMNRAGLETDYPINDDTSPLIASHLVKLGGTRGTIKGNCTFR